MVKLLLLLATAAMAAIPVKWNGSDSVTVSQGQRVCSDTITAQYDATVLFYVKGNRIGDSAVVEISNTANAEKITLSLHSFREEFTTMADVKAGDKVSVCLDGLYLPSSTATFDSATVEAIP